MCGKISSVVPCSILREDSRYGIGSLPSILPEKAGGYGAEPESHWGTWRVDSFLAAGRAFEIGIEFLKLALIFPPPPLQNHPNPPPPILSQLGSPADGSLSAGCEVPDLLGTCCRRCCRYRKALAPRFAFGSGGFRGKKWRWVGGRGGNRFGLRVCSFLNVERKWVERKWVASIFLLLAELGVGCMWIF